MSYLAPGKQAVRASATLLRSARAAGIASARAQPRLFHDSAKAKAVIAAQQPTAMRPVPEFIPGPGPVPASVPKGQLNILEQNEKPEFYQAISKIMKLRQQYIEQRYIWVPAEQMIDIVLGLGARKEDIAALCETSEHLYFDPTLPYRKSRNGRYCYDYDTNTIRRLEFQPFLLSKSEDFNRYDSDQLRRFDEIEDNIQLNSVMQALLIFKGMMTRDVKVAPRPNLDYSGNKDILTLFSVRTFTNPDVLGEPALEGIHSDGVDHTLTTLLGYKNMRMDSAATFMHAQHEKTGIPLNSAKPENIRARVQHTKILDTLMIVDHENKHSLNPVYQEDPEVEASRDMLILFTRKPAEEAHVSGKIDSMRPHQSKPMELPLFVPPKMGKQ
jgi:hypothetical protein